jgi:hypothetical protein
MRATGRPFGVALARMNVTALIWSPITTVELQAEREGCQMKDAIAWLAVIVSGVALLIAAIGAALALLTGHARFIEIAWISIAASLFLLACEYIGKRNP